MICYPTKVTALHEPSNSLLPYPILIRRHTHCLLERAAEILRILIAEAVGYLADALAGLREQLLGHIHRPLLDVFLRRAAGLLLYQVAEVVGREMQLVGTPCHGGRAEALGIVRHEIAVEQRLEACEDILVRPLARDELAVVEAVAVVEEQLDGRGDDDVAVAVGAVPYLVVNLSQTVDDGLALLKRQVEGLAHVVREERVVLDVASERRSAQQFGTEIEAPALDLICRAVGGITEHQSGRYEHEGVLLIVILAAAVFQIVGAPHVLQEYDVQADVLAAVRYRLRHLRAFKHVHKRMAAGQSPIRIIVAHCFDVNNLVHSRLSLVCKDTAKNNIFPDNSGQSVKVICQSVIWISVFRHKRDNFASG